MKLKRVVKSLFLAGMLVMVVAQMTGCGAAHTAIKKRNLDVQTKMSETIFLEPTSPDKRIIFVDVRNTSDKEIDIKGDIINNLKANGYVIANDPAKATFMLQANVLQVGKSDLRSAQGALAGGFGGAVLGAAAGYAAHPSGSNMAAGGLIGAAVGVIADALVDDTYFSMITDVQIRERPLAGEVVTQTQAANAAQGNATNVSQAIKGGKVEWKIYRTRVVSTANKVNLDFEEAKPVLRSALVKSLSGLF